MRMADSGRGGLLSRWETSLKVPALFLLMLCMAFVRKPELITLLPVISAGLFIVSGKTLRSLLSILRIPLLLVLAVGVFIALFSGGEPLLTLGAVRLSREGALEAAGILVRVASVVTVGSVLTRTTSLTGLSRSLRRIGVPSVLTDMGVLTGRYIRLIGEDHGRMLVARRLRGYRSGRSFFRDLGVAVQASATLLIRSFKRSERVFHAMKLRGYGQAGFSRGSGHVSYTISDYSLLAATVLVSVLLLVLEFV